MTQDFPSTAPEPRRRNHRAGSPPAATTPLPALQVEPRERVSVSGVGGRTARGIESGNRIRFGFRHGKEAFRLREPGSCFMPHPAAPGVDEVSGCRDLAPCADECADECRSRTAEPLLLVARARHADIQFGIRRPQHFERRQGVPQCDVHGKGRLDGFDRMPDRRADGSIRWCVAHGTGLDEAFPR